jgi:iron(III) transport system permease protein
VGRALSASSRSFQQRATFAGASAVVVVTVLIPLAAVATHLSVQSLAVLGWARPWTLLARSVALATAVTAGALALGVPAGAVFARARVPFRRALLALHLFPMFLPPFFSALGWFQLLGVRGPLGGERVSAVFFGPVGAWGVLVLTFAPVLTALTALGIRSLDSSLEEAGRIVAAPGQVLARILVPAARPQIALGALLVFALSLGELGVPMFLRVDVYPAAVFARLGGVEQAPGEAAALGLPLVAVALVLTALERRLFSRSDGSVLSLRPEREPIDLGVGATLLALVAALLSVTPIAALAVRAAPSAFLLPTWLGSSVQNGLLVSLAGAAVATPVGIVLGHALARREGVSRLVDTGLLFAFFVPSAVLGIGIVRAWNRPATAFVYASEAVLLLAFVGRYGVLSVRAFAASSQQTSPSYEEAAAVAGSGYLRRLVRIVVPMQRRGVLAAFGLTLIFCLRDLETAVLFYPPGGEPLTVRIFTLEANGPPGVVAGLAVLHATVTAVVLVALTWTFGRSGT